ncbi:MAG: choice-of-anchor Q domain-containing protein [Patescibacteria group bacterium]|jgi:hypothetical protein
MATQLKKTVKPSGGDYTSLEACMNANEQNLVTADKYFDVEIDGTWSSPDSRCIIYNYTTDATRYINVYTTSAARHNGIYSSSKYEITNTSELEGAIKVKSNYVRISGIQASQSTIGTTTYMLSCIGVADGGDYLLVSNCICKLTSAGRIMAGITLGAGGGAINNIIYNTNTAAKTNIKGISITTGESGAVLYNNTVYGCDVGISSSNQTIANATNNICTTNAVDFSSNWGYTASADNISTDATSPNNEWDSITLANIKFVSTTAGSEDFHLQVGSAAIDVGTDLSASFTDDIDGETRPTGANTWDIGADEYIAVVPAAPSSDGAFGSGRFNRGRFGTNAFGKPRFKT